MTNRQIYWANLAYIHSRTGVWARRTSFQAASELATALAYYLETGYDSSLAMERSWDHVRYNKRGTLVLRGMAV